MSVSLASNKVLEISSRIERLPFSTWQVKVLVIISVFTFFDAFDAMAIAFALPALIGTWSLKPQYVGFLISAGFLGQLLGAITFGRLAERIGRLHTMIITVLVFSILSLCCAASWSYASLLVLRLIQGFGLGGEAPVAATYLNEIVGARIGGKYGMFLIILSFGIGLLLASFGGYWIVPHFGWRWLFVVGGVPAAIVAYLAYALPESPRWLAGVGRVTEAEGAMAAIERKVRTATNADLPAPIAPTVAPAATHTSFVQLFEGIYLRRTIVVWVIWFSAYLANYGVNTWLPTIYRTVFHLPLDKSALYSMVTLIFGTCAGLAAVLLVDVIGRRLVIGTCFLVGGILFLGLWLMGASSAGQVVVFTTLGWLFFSVICTVTYVYTPEVYPTRIRALGTSVATAWLRLAAMIGPVFVGMVIAHYGEVSRIFLFYGLIALIAGIVVLVLGIETKRGRYLKKFRPKTSSAVCHV